MNSTWNVSWNLATFSDNIIFFNYQAFVCFRAPPSAPITEPVLSATVKQTQPQTNTIASNVKSPVTKVKEKPSESNVDENFRQSVKLKIGSILGLTGAAAGTSQNLTKKAIEEKNPVEDEKSIIKPDQMNYLNSIDTIGQNEAKVDPAIDDSTSEENMASEQVCNWNYLEFSG